MSKWEDEIKQAEQAGCKECHMSTLAQMRVCQVCRLIDKDESEKLCKWCGVCNAWICEKDETQYVRRSIAFFNRLANKQL